MPLWEDCFGKLIQDSTGSPIECEEDPCEDPDPGELLGCYTVPTGFGLGTEVAVRATFETQSFPSSGCTCSYFSQTFLLSVTSITASGFTATGTFFSGACPGGPLNWRVFIQVVATNACSINVSYSTAWRFGTGSFTADENTSWSEGSLGSPDLREVQGISYSSRSGTGAFCQVVTPFPDAEVWIP